jgi:hypothetical protein
MKVGMVALAIRATLSLILLLSGLWVILTSNLQTDPLLIAAATGWVGLICGYWLK